MDICMVDPGFEDTDNPSTEPETPAAIEDTNCERTLITFGQPEITSRHDDPLNPLPMQFGCKWDPVDYSCAYDCIFTAFAWIYFHATDTWREKWTQESPTAHFLSGHFKNILSALSGPTPDHTVPALFAEGRDTWRDRLSQRSPTEFPRRGPKYASATRVLEVLAKDRNPSHYATIVLSCTTAGCPLRVKNLEAKYYMLVPLDWETSTGQTSPHLESLETWIKSHYSSPDLTNTAEWCARCQRRFSRKLVFRQPTWIWLEVFSECRDVIIPALKISLGSATLRLAAVIYFNGNHYRARLCDPSENWWFHDGQWYGGRPRPLLKIPDERDLFQCGDFNVTALVYCLMDW